MKSHKEIKAHVEKYVNAEKNAHFIVERLALAESLDEKEVSQIINAITPEHYADIIEERAISKSCGYILCNNKLEQVSKQKYHISLKSNKVYDITERKQFCSNFCFKASKWLEKQVPSTSLLDRKSSLIVDVLKRSELSGKRSDIQVSEDVLISEELHSDVELQSDEMVGRSIVDSKAVNPGVTQKETKPLLDTVETILTEWFTDETAEVVKSQILSPLYKPGFEVPNEEYSVQQKNLRERTLEEYPYEANEKETINSLSDTFDAKLSINERHAIKPMPEENIVLPHLDHKAQQGIRRKIVGERLRRSFGRILPTFGLQLSDMNSSLTKLIKSFSFSSRNILLSLMEWRLMTLILLQLTSHFTPSLQKAMLENREAHNGLLMALNTDVNAVERIAQTLLAKCDQTPSETYSDDLEELD